MSAMSESDTRTDARSLMTRRTSDSYRSKINPATKKRTKRLHHVKTFIWNPENHTFLNRTGEQWGYLVAYYVVFYTVLILMFAGFLTVFLLFIVSNDVPFQTGEQNLLRMKPGLAIRPVADFMTTNIQYTMGHEQSYQAHTQNIQAFLSTYEQHYQLSDDSYATCDPREGKKSTPDPERVCRFFLNYLDDCQKENMYGYDRGKPCVILKLNKVFGWVPKLTNGTEHPMVRCTGKHEMDRYYLGRVNYYPNLTTESGETLGYFSHVYYPYLCQAGYRPPLVAIQFMQITKFLVMMIRCELVNVNGPSYGVDFELNVN